MFEYNHSYLKGVKNQIIGQKIISPFAGSFMEIFWIFKLLNNCSTKAFF